MLSVRARRAGLKERDETPDSTFWAPLGRSVVFFGVRESEVASWALWVGEAADDGGVKSSTSAVGKAEPEPETSLADSWSGAGRE